VGVAQVARPTSLNAERIAMNRCKAGSVLLAVTIAVPAADALTGDNFQRLKGSQIQAKFAGMEMTDEVHWADIYGRDGALTTYEMGKKRVGKWWVQRDELCHDRGKDMKGCYEVWISGKKVELRGQGMPLEGVLQNPANRK